MTTTTTCLPGLLLQFVDKGEEAKYFENYLKSRSQLIRLVYCLLLTLNFSLIVKIVYHNNDLSREIYALLLIPLTLNQFLLAVVLWMMSFSTRGIRNSCSSTTFNLLTCAINVVFGISVYSFISHDISSTLDNLLLGLIVAGIHSCLMVSS